MMSLMLKLAKFNNNNVQQQVQSSLLRLLCKYSITPTTSTIVHQTEKSLCLCHHLLSTSSTTSPYNVSHQKKFASTKVLDKQNDLPILSNEASEDKLADNIESTVSNQIDNHLHGRLFAVVHICGHQFKVTTEDLILIHTNESFPDVGERIRLEKVLVVGGADFSLIGRPLLRNVVVEATVIEKTLGYAKTWYLYKRRKNVRKMRLTQELQTVLRINSIRVNPLTETAV